MTRDPRRAPHPGLILLAVFKLIVAIVPDVMRHAPDVVRAVPPPRVAVDDAFAGVDGTDLARAVERLADVPVSDVVDLVAPDPDGGD